MSASEVCIVVAAHTREESLNRCLESLRRAKYETGPVDLVISIDHSPLQPAIERVAQGVDWTAGSKFVRAFQEHLGLRRHILRCGDLTESYEIVVVLEDDIVVGREFMRFAVSTAAYYKEEDRIAGISLYAPAVNEMAGLPFSPQPSAFDVYFLQSTQSWGQCWTTAMWQKFRKWYAENDASLMPERDMPAQIYKWPESSWKKYHMKYCVETERTWVYPYVSHTTNASEPGMHHGSISKTYEVPLCEYRRDYTFAKYGDAPEYDVFFERKGLHLTTKRYGMAIMYFDFYGTRTALPSEGYVASMCEFRLPIVARYGLRRRPPEVNVIEKVQGREFIVQYASEECILRGEKASAQVPLQVLKYAYGIRWYDALRLGFYGAFQFGLRIMLKRRNVHRNRY